MAYIYYKQNNPKKIYPFISPLISDGVECVFTNIKSTVYLLMFYVCVTRHT